MLKRVAMCWRSKVMRPERVRRISRHWPSCPKMPRTTSLSKLNWKHSEAIDMNACRSLIAVSVVALVAGCSATSNAPTPSPLPVVQNKTPVLVSWRQSLGSAEGARLQPALRGDAIAAMSGEKKLVLLDAKSGVERWQVSLPNPAAGGVGLGDDLVVVGTLKGEILAFGRDGKSRWTARASSEVIAPPVIAGSLVLVRGGD